MHRLVKAEVSPENTKGMGDLGKKEAEEAQPLAFQIGDRVEAINGKNKGRLGTVQQVDPLGDPVVLYDGEEQAVLRIASFFRVVPKAQTPSFYSPTPRVILCLSVSAGFSKLHGLQTAFNILPPNGHVHSPF